jgi:hypothetical protein
MAQNQGDNSATTAANPAQPEPGAVQLVPGPGVVVHRAPLTVALSPATGDGGPEAAHLTALVDRLVEEHAELDFAPVAAGLQDFVVAYQPLGVAAVLDLSPEPIVFLFDRAVATNAQVTHRGDGRANWTTDFVAGDSVTLSVAADDSAPGWARLLGGTVQAAGAVVPLLGATRAQTLDAPTPPSVPAPIPASERVRPAPVPSPPPSHEPAPAPAPAHAPEGAGPLPGRPVVIGAQPPNRTEAPSTTAAGPTGDEPEALAG